MCGRFTLTQPDQLALAFGVALDRVPPPRFNIAPSQPVGVIVSAESRERQFRLMRWGLIPSWAKDPKMGDRLINARLETAHEKPSFRAAFKRRRCLIPADGFYEWQQSAKPKQPFYFQGLQSQLLAFAGLWEAWQDIETCTILTTAANGDLQPIHDRMPVILSPEHYDRWLDPQSIQSIEIQSWVAAITAPGLSATPVSTCVNQAQVDTPDCVQPLASR